MDRVSTRGDPSLERKKYGHKAETHLVLTQGEQADVRKAIEEKRPEDFGITGKSWTLGRAKEYIQRQHGKVVNARTLSDYMKRWVMSCSVQRSVQGNRTLRASSSQGSVRFMVYQDIMNQQRLIQFMERLIRSAEQKVFLILDNLKVHHGKLIAVWLEKHKKNIETFFLLPYAPEYNPDEYLNHALKISVHSGHIPYFVEHCANS